MPTTPGPFRPAKNAYEAAIAAVARPKPVPKKGNKK